MPLLTFGTKPGHFHSVSTLITNEATACAEQSNYPAGARRTVDREVAIHAENVYQYAQKLVDKVQQYDNEHSKLPFLFYPVNEGGTHWIMFIGVNVLEDDKSGKSGYFAYNPQGDNAEDVAFFSVQTSARKTELRPEEAGFLLFVDAMRSYNGRAPHRHPDNGVQYMAGPGRDAEIVARYTLQSTSVRQLRRLSIPAGYVERQPNGFDCGVGCLLLCFQFIRRFPFRCLNKKDFDDSQLATGLADFPANYRYKLKEAVMTNKKEPWSSVGPVQRWRPACGTIPPRVVWMDG